MRYAVETWSPEYGVAADEGALVESTGKVDVDVEVPAARWAPRTPPGDLEPPASIGFVDGVRRIDARVWITDGGRTRPGVCASVAAGLVICETRADGGRARVVEAQVRRGLFTPAGDEVGPIATRHGAYALHPTTDDSAEALYLGVHEQMTALEAEVSRSAGCELLVFDGPLRGRSQPGAVGYVKTQHVQYLPDELQPVIGQLAAGQRTPVFLAGHNGLTRWSWYVRLPAPRTHPLAAVVRCELPAAGTVGDAATRADLVTSLLPRFASERHKDPRAPQNLYPIAGLEHALRRRLGDPLVLERALRLAAVDTAA